MTTLKTLGGICFIRNAIQFDYHILETIDCLADLCDKVVVLDAGSDDGTLSLITEHLKGKYGDYDTVIHTDMQYDVTTTGNNKIMLVIMRPEDWEREHGKEKLAYFQNVAANFLSTDYVFLLQADEIAHEDSFPWVRQAMEEGIDGYHVHRLNLWGHPDYYLNVPQERKPCSDVVLRLAKRGHLSYGDGESLECYPVSDGYLSAIKILHYGFVRSRDKMVGKIVNMQRDVFETSVDAKLDGMTLFNPWAWFTKDDLQKLEIEHPKYIQNWVNARRKEYDEIWQQ